MYNKITIIVITCLFARYTSVVAQIWPAENRSLNYRLIGFAFPATQGAGKYTIEIAEGNIYNADSFKSNIVQTVHSKINKIVAEVPHFGRHYTWRYAYTIAAQKKVVTDELHHFSTGFCPEVDTNNVRLRIINKATKYKDAYVFLDGMRALYDMNGRPVWFLPDVSRFKGPPMRQTPAVKNIVPASVGPFIPANDMKLSPWGTVTFVFFETVYEVDYDGNILWSAPDENKLAGEQREFYHHEFTRLSNGNYLALKNGYATTWWKWQQMPGRDSMLVFVPVDKIAGDGKNIMARKTELPIINIYDTKGNTIWSWNSSRYFIEEDKGRELERCILMNENPAQWEVHANSLYFNETDSAIYVGFRNISRVIKIKYPSGVVIKEIGDDKTFCYQHSAHPVQDGLLCLYNNNLCHGGSMPEALIVKEPKDMSVPLEVVWSYHCTYEAPHPEHDHGAPDFIKGGNAALLPDRSVFINMGSNYSKLLIVGSDKKIIWSALPEKYDPSHRDWENLLQYKACIITSKQLESLIWAH